MKISYSRAWGMPAFHTHISDISTYREYEYDITDPYIIYPRRGIKYTHQSTSTTPTSASSTCKCGGMEKMDERIGR